MITIGCACKETSIHHTPITSHKTEMLHLGGTHHAIFRIFPIAPILLLRSFLY